MSPASRESANPLIQLVSPRDLVTEAGHGDYIGTEPIKAPGVVHLFSSKNTPSICLHQSR